MKIRIAQIKLPPIKGDLVANFEALRGCLRELRAESPDVVVTSECFLDGYVATEATVSADDLRRYAIEPATSPHARAVSEWAAQNRAWFVFGCTRLEGRGVCNSALIYNRSGQLAGVYDKVHLQTHDVKFFPGQGLPVFDSDFGRFGVMICADRRWPETVRTLALRGARVIFNPTYGMSGEFNSMILRVRSYESEVFIAFTHPLESLLTAPQGQVVRQETSAAARWIVTEVDLAEVDAVRKAASAHLHDRRPELYER